MRCALVLLIALASFIGGHLSAADKKPVDPALVRTFTAKQPVKLGDAVASFVIDLIHKNTAGVQDDYAKLTADTEADAAGRYETHPFEGIQWFVVEVSWDNADKYNTSEVGEYIYLARQQLVAGIHRGYGVPTNVVAQVRVVTSFAGKAAKSLKGDQVAPGTKITLTFEGFLDKVPLTLPQN
ncbi:MAG: hypothetical protein ABJF10_00645 [Chthoniobacter sp.]|uniref:hypothetical protein n=1 Tax=Chthoniobacter sp. TaxID=2510640 RepID=UPI0032A2E4BB